MIKELRSRVEALLGETGGIRARLARGIAWTTAGTLIGYGLTLTANVILARVLGRTEYGEFGVVWQVVMTFSVFAAPTFGVMTTRYVAELRRVDPERLGRIIGLSMAVGATLSFAVAVVTAVFAYPLAVLLENPDLAVALQVGSLALALTTLEAVQRGALAGFEAFKTLAWLNLVKGAVGLPLFWLLAERHGVVGAVWALAIGIAISLVVGRINVVRLCRLHQIQPTWRGCWSERGALTSFSLPALLSAAVTMFAMLGGTTVLVRSNPQGPGSGFAEQGLFHAAHNWKVVVQFLTSVVNQAFLPVLSNLQGEGRWGEFRKSLRINLVLAGGLTGVAGLTVASLSHLLIGLFGAEYAAGAPVLATLMLSVVLASVTSAVGVGLWSRGHLWQSLWLNAAWSAVFVVFASWLAPMGALGLAQAYLIAYAVHLLTGMWAYRWLLGKLPRVG